MDTPAKRCPKCCVDLPLSSFTRSSNDRLNSYCKPCLSLYCRRHYVKNSKEHNARRAASRRAYRARNRAFIVEFFRTHPCIDCGESDPVVLEFDHVNRAEKSMEVSTLSCDGRSLELLKREISRCVVRCAHCHRLRTARQFRWAKGIYPAAGM